MKFFEKFFYRHVVPFIASKNCSDVQNMSSAVFIIYFYIFCKNSIFSIKKTSSYHVFRLENIQSKLQIHFKQFKRNVCWRLLLMTRFQMEVINMNDSQINKNFEIN